MIGLSVIAFRSLAACPECFMAANKRLIERGSAGLRCGRKAADSFLNIRKSRGLNGRITVDHWHAEAIGRGIFEDENVSRFGPRTDDEGSARQLVKPAWSVECGKSPRSSTGISCHINID
jgi:hypothetical protein